MVKHPCECTVHFGTDHFELLINIHLIAVKHCVSSAINIGGAKLNMCNVSHLDFFPKNEYLTFPPRTSEVLKP